MIHCPADKRSAVERVFVKINGELHYLWRAVDNEGEVLESYVTKSRNRKATLDFLRKAMKKYGMPDIIVTDKSRSYGAVLKDIGCEYKQCTKPLSLWGLNNRGENSHLPFRQKPRMGERAFS